MIDEETFQLVRQVMYGRFPRNEEAAEELQQRGVPESVTEEWKRKGFFLKDAARANPPDSTRVIQAESIPEPYFVWEKRQRQSFFNRRTQYDPYTARPDRTRVASGRYAGGQGTSIGSYLSDNYLKLSALGMDVAMMGGDYKLHINNFDLLEKAARKGKFVANWNGQQVWKLNFWGNQHVPAKVVAAEKAAFQSTFKTLKLVKFAGSLATGISFSMSGYDLLMEDTVHERAKATLDLLMTGVAFFPGYGWAISGIYFLYTGGLSLHDDDWWNVF